MTNGFTLTRVYFSKTGNTPYIIGGSTHYTLSEYGQYVQDKVLSPAKREIIPKNGSKIISYMEGYNARLIVKCD